MKKFKEVLPLVALTVAVAQNAGAEPVSANATALAPEKAKVSESAKTAISNKIKTPGNASGAFAEENGPTFVEWSQKQKGAVDKLNEKVINPNQNIDIQKSAGKLRQNN